VVLLQGLGRCGDGGAALLGLLCIKLLCHVSHCARVGMVFEVDCTKSERIADTNGSVCLRSCSVVTTCHPTCVRIAEARLWPCVSSCSMMNRPPGANQSKAWFAMANGIAVPWAKPTYSAICGSCSASGWLTGVSSGIYGGLDTTASNLPSNVSSCASADTILARSVASAHKTVTL